VPDAPDPTAGESALDKIRQTRLEREAAEAFANAKIDAWKEAIREADAAGVSVPDIVKIAGVNRQRVYVILAEKKDEDTE
jgi:hypothetical protein